MFFYQIRSKVARTIDLSNYECPNCKAKNHLQLSILQKYSWLFAPIMPAGKSAILHCNACEQSIPIKNWTKDLDQMYRTEKKNTNTPVRYWSGTIFAALIWIIPITMIKMGVTNPFGLKNDGATIVQGRKDLENVKANDILYVSDLSKKGALSYNAIKIVEELPNGIATIKKGKASYSGFQDQYNLKAENFTDADFDDELLKIDLAYMKKNKSIVLIDKNKVTSHRAAMVFYSLIK